MMWPAAPFTVCADLDLRRAGSHWLRAHGSDVTIRRGPVPDSLPKLAWTTPRYQYAEGRLLFTAFNGVRFLLEDGRMVRYAWPSDLDAATTRAQAVNTILGPVWAMVAMQRGLLPLHAGANKARAGHDVHAFTGQSGAGKSTLAAGLSAHEYPLFTDDILVLDPASIGETCRCWGLPRLRLWPEALTMLGGAESGPRVCSVSPAGKREAEPCYVSPAVSGRMRTLYVLAHANGDEEARKNGTRIEPLRSARAVSEWMRAVMRPALAFQMLGQRQLLEWAVAAAEHVDMFVFRRLMTPERWEDDTCFLARALSDDNAN